jgi:hypothetical protein
MNSPLVSFFRRPYLRDVDGKRAPDVHDAFDADVSPVQLDVLLCDGKRQARAAAAFCGFDVISGLKTSSNWVSVTTLLLFCTASRLRGMQVKSECFAGESPTPIYCKLTVVPYKSVIIVRTDINTK